MAREYLWSRMYSENVKKGHEYQKLPDAIAINIVDFDFPAEGSFHTCFHLREDVQPDFILTSALHDKRMNSNFISQRIAKDAKLLFGLLS